MIRVSTPQPPAIGAGVTDGGGHFTSLLRWYRPNLRGSGRLLALSLVAIALVLACQAVIPLVVHALLEGGRADARGLSVLVGLAVLQLIASFAGQRGAAVVASDSAFRLRLRVFNQLLHTRVLRQEGLVRSSVVSRHTTDIDHVGEAFGETIGQGIPGIIRVVQSLILLAFIDWRAGLVMTMAVALFVLIRRFVGSRLLVSDQARLSASSRVGESVDEAITASRLIAGLHLDRWAQSRFSTRADRLRTTTHEQVNRVTQLHTGAQAAGLAGLVAVVFVGLYFGGGSLATVAAALLYVEGVVRGLEALPGWIRSLQLGVVSRRRIDQILRDETGPVDPPAILASMRSGPPSSEMVTAEPGSIVGLVTTPGLDADAVLTALSTGSLAESWRATLEGHDIRRPGVRLDVLHVTAEPAAFNDSVLALLAAADPALTSDQSAALLESVGLGHIGSTGPGLDRPLGPGGSLLSANERQRLALAFGLAARPRLLLVGPLIAMSDVDAALPLLVALGAARDTTSIITVRSAEIARAMDAMLFVSEDEIAYGDHTELLVTSSAYARLWERRLAPADVDLSVLGLAKADEVALQGRLVTERYEPGEAIYRQDEAADRIVFVISGHVEIGTRLPDGGRRRVAVLSPGNHCGDLRLTVGERRAESAYAMDVCIVRSLSRDAVSAGLSGLLERTPTERRIVSCLLRTGVADIATLTARLGDLGPEDIADATAALLEDGALRESNGGLSVVMRRSARTGAGHLLDRLAEL